MVSNFFNEANKNNIQLIFTTKASFLIRNSEGKVVEGGSLWEKVRYIVLCVFSFGYYSVGHLYTKHCNKLENACIQPASKKRITVKRTCDVFQKLFPNNKELSAAAKALKQAKTKSETSSAKRKVKAAIDSVINGGYYGNCKTVKKLREINFHPRLAEAKFAVSKGIEPKKLNGSHLAAVYKVYSRDRKCLAVFKKCEKDSGDAKNELLVSDTLGKVNSLNVKKSFYTALPISGKTEQGIFQKFIVGDTLFNKVEDKANFHIEGLSDDAVDELHTIGIFDLINLNSDRHANNLMIDRKGHLWAIDHGLLTRGTPFGKAFIKHWPELTNRPFSPKLVEYIKSLNINVHCSKSLSEEQRVFVGKVIKFLKYSVADERKVKLNLYQIYQILDVLIQKSWEIPEDPKKCLEEGLRQVILNNENSQEWKTLCSLFPEAGKNIYSLKGLGEEFLLPFDIDHVLERIERRGTVRGLAPELCLEYLLAHEKDLIKPARGGKPFTRKELEQKSWIFKGLGLRKFVEVVAKPTKYYDPQAKTFAPELEAFISRWDGWAQWDNQALCGFIKI